MFQVDAITSVQRQIRFSTACYPKDFGGDFTTSSDMHAADFLIRVSARAQEEKLPFQPKLRDPYVLLHRKFDFKWWADN